MASTRHSFEETSAGAAADSAVAVGIAVVVGTKEVVPPAGLSSLAADAVVISVVAVARTN